MVDQGQAQRQGQPRNNNNGGVGGGGGMPDVIGWFWSLPPITRTWFGLSLGITAATSLELLHHEDLIFNWNGICRKLELWRIATSFIYGGGLIHEFHVLLALHMIAMQSSTYEVNPHLAGGGNPRTDYVFCLLVCVVTTIITFLIQERFTNGGYGYLYPLFTRTLLTCITYLWARRNPRLNVEFLFIPIQGQYLPFCHIALALALRNPIYELVHGMLVGHIYYFLVEVVPTILGGRRLLVCPSILTEIVNDIYGPQQEFRQQQQPAQQQQQEQPQPAQQPQQQEPEPPQQQTTNNVHDDMTRRYQNEGATEAHIAAKMNRIERLRALSASADGRAEFAARDHNHWQPLHEAARGGHLEVVNYLLEFPDLVDMNSKTKHGLSPLWLAEDALGADHPVTKRLQELGAIKHGPQQ